jgi:hypothetical protein
VAGWLERAELLNALAEPVEELSFDLSPVVSLELAGLREVWENEVVATNNIANSVSTFFMALYFVWFNIHRREYKLLAKK